MHQLPLDVSSIDSCSSMRFLFAVPVSMSIGDSMLMYVPSASKLRVPSVPWPFDRSHEDLYTKISTNVDEALGSPMCADYATL